MSRPQKGYRPATLGLVSTVASTKNTMRSALLLIWGSMNTGLTPRSPPLSVGAILPMRLRWGWHVVACSSLARDALAESITHILDERVVEVALPLRCALQVHFRQHRIVPRKERNHIQGAVDQIGLHGHAVDNDPVYVRARARSVDAPCRSDGLDERIA